MKIAAAYIRVSTDDQVEYSPASQLEKIREYAKRNDYILPNEFIFMDEGISGRNTRKRAEFNRMIGIAKQEPKPFDAILLWKFSRFARNREDSIVYKSMLRKQCGIDVISISENVGDDKMSVLIEALIEAMDEYYSINLGEEVKRGMAEKVSRGEAVSIPSLGYIIENGTYVPDSATAPLIKRIFYDFLNGKAMRTLAMQLNSEGFKTRRGNLFESRTIQYILRNPVYVGKIRWTPTGRTRRDFNNPDTMIIDGTHQPIIDMQTWNAVQNKLDSQNKAKYMRKSSAKHPFMLQGLVRCNNCGSTLCNAQGKYLQCYSYAHGKCAVSHSISIKKLNKMVIDALEKSATTGDFKLNIRSPKLDTTGSDIKTQIERERVKLNRILDAYENGVYTVEELKDRRRHIEKAINTLERKMPDAKTIDIQAAHKKLQNKIIDLLPALKTPAIPENEKSEILKSFIERIVFYKPQNDIDIFFYV